MLSYQGVLLGQQDQSLPAPQAENQHLQQALKNLRAYVTNLSPHFLPIAAAQPQPLSAREPRAPDPEPYDGTLGKCCGFLLQCSHVFLSIIKPSTQISPKFYISYSYSGAEHQLGRRPKFPTVLCSHSLVSFLDSFKGGV